MQGRKLIKQLKDAVICFRDKANEIIAWCNRDWEIKLPVGDNSLVAVRASEDKVAIDLSQLGTVTLIACDENQVQATYVLYGYKKTDPPAP